MAPSKVKTSKVKDRRTLRFGRMHELLDDVTQFNGSIRTTGNWTPAQIVGHVAGVIECSLDGFAVANAPLIIRGIAKMMRTSILIKPMRAGVKLPRKFNFLVPPENMTWEEAREKLRVVVDRIENKGQRMRHRSPLLGHLEHEEWIQLHCRHAEMHFSFLHEANDEAEEPPENNPKGKPLAG
ncbi:MAG: DUF1569 domain-containing protein [Planctomycetes bacterium]|nr:DUF1569 domain-containing protein [Planctomycetota bacterium]